MFTPDHTDDTVTAQGISTVHPVIAGPLFVTVTFTVPPPLQGLTVYDNFSPDPDAVAVGLGLALRLADTVGVGVAVGLAVGLGPAAGRPPAQ